MGTELIDAALEYNEKFDYPIIPVNPENKRPLIKWVEFQSRKSTTQEIKRWWNQWPNAMIGGVTGKIANDFVIDIDGPVGDEAIQDYLPEGLITPTSSTPRGGKHLHFLNPEDDITIKSSLFPHVDYRGQGGYICLPPSKNSEGKSYSWLPGLSLLDVSKASLPELLINYIKNILINNNYYNNTSTSINTSIISTTRDYCTTSYANLYFKRYKSLQNGESFFRDGMRDESLFHVANAMVKNRSNPDMICEVLERLILSWGEKPDLKWIEAKINSAIERAARKERNLTQEIEQWVALQERYFSVTNCYNELQIVTKEQKNLARQVFFRLKKAEVIEKYGDREGVYRRVEGEAESIDFMSVDEKVIDLVWPFELETWVKILPKNIVVIAGESNSGKTGFLLNLCWNNMGRFKINYFSSEMGAMELRARLEKFQGKLSHWKEHINFKERSSNFADVVKPNDINIIDFLEITDEFYKVGGIIKEIYDKLKKGIAIIALQKNRGTDIGLGGMRSVEKARLYLSMENNKIKIVKGKNWASDTNPNGLVRSFKLIQGAKFTPTSEWERDYEKTQRP